MNINDAFPSDYLKASDLGERDVTVTIESVEMVRLGQGRDVEDKMLVRFAGKKKGLICNKTNANTIASMYGSDTDDWTGKLVVLGAREVEFQGNMVWAIRVSLKKPVVPGAPASKPAKTQPPEPPPQAESEDMPF